ncbi:uncharacterized protein [Nicotiana tomentosiformis]|uniref:uncharacterized protein n=1 Tax=Nicotiana tomentosiformis TaxID=4098 RepID=UPI00388CAA39
MGKALCDMEIGELTFRIGDEKVVFHMFKSMRQPSSNEVSDVIVDDTSTKINVGDMLEDLFLSFDDDKMDSFMECVNNLQEMGSKTPPTKLSIEEPPTLELKPLPPHLQYEFLGPCSTLPVILSSCLTNVHVDSTLAVLQKRKKAIRWTLKDIRGISPAFRMHKIKLEDGTKLSIEYQRRLNEAMQEVVNKDIIKWLDVGRMPFGLCNAPTTFQNFMMAIFMSIVEDYLKVFMDDFSVVGHSFDDCLANLDKVLAKCEETKLVLNWEKCNFMVDEGIVLGHKNSKNEIEDDKAKIKVISKLPPQTSVKGVRSFLVHGVSTGALSKISLKW